MNEILMKLLHKIGFTVSETKLSNFVNERSNELEEKASKRLDNNFNKEKLEIKINSLTYISMCFSLSIDQIILLIIQSMWNVSTSKSKY